jgi:hypothetical protein
VAYGWRGLDSRTQIWPALGLDYSTHSAVTFALVTRLSVASRPLRLPAAVSLVVYYGLMLYQRYHSIADILSTLAIVAPLRVLLAGRFGAQTRLPAIGRRSR